MKITVVSSNEGRNISALNVALDFLKLLKFVLGLGRHFLVGFQEIDEADKPNEHSALLKTYAKFQVTNAKGHEPQVVSNGLKVIKAYRVFAMKGITHVSPDRFFSVTIVEFGLLRKRRFAFVDTHYVADAYNKAIENHQKAVFDGWQEHFAAHKKLVNDLVGQGLSVVWVGDVNRIHPPMPLVHEHERRVHVKGMDIISVIEAPTGVKFETVKQGSLANHSDHDAQWVQLKVN